jgi:hypothetical protein
LILVGLVTTAEQNQELVSTPNEIDAIAGAMVDSLTPFPTGFASPKFPNESLRIRAAMRAFASTSRSFVNQSWKMAVRRTSITCEL